MPAVVSDTSVLHYLATLGQVELLQLQFGNVFVPPAVWRELHARPQLPGSIASDAALATGWLKIQNPEPGLILTQLSAILDPGEAEAIALAAELKPAVVLLDEAEGRSAARNLGLSVIGTVGILARARASGHLPKLKPLIDRLINNHQFRLSHEIYEQLVKEDGPI